MAGRQVDDVSPGFKITELGPLPEEWEVVRLGDVARVSAGGSAPQGSAYFGGEYPFVRVQHLEDDGYEVRRWHLITNEAVQKYHLRLFPAGTIVFPKSGASIRLEKRAVISRPSYLASHLCAVIARNDVVDAEFLFFALKSIALATEKAQGYPTLSLTEIRQRVLPLPPLPEQRAIAHVLRTVQRTKEATDGVIAALKELRKSLMRHLFTYGPVPVDQGDHVQLKETEIGPVPEGWEVVRLGEVSRFGGDRRPGSLDSAMIPFISMSLLPVDRLYITAWEMRHPSEIRSGIPVREGDFLVAKITPCLENGKQAIVRGLPGGWGYATTEVIRIQPAPKLDVEYVALYLRQPTVREELAGKMEGTTGRQRLPKTVLESLPVPLPPLPEQRAIAEILRNVDRKIEAEENRKTALDALFKTLLYHLMTGKVRVGGVLSGASEAST